MAGVLTVSVLSAAGCWKEENATGDIVTEKSIETSDTERMSDDTTVDELSNVVYQDAKPLVEQEAEALAESLGMEKKDLHGRYDLFLDYADCVINNPKMAEYRGYALYLFPMVADHLKDENTEYFLETLKDLKMESVYLQANNGEFYSWENKISVFGDGIVYDTEATYETVLHELTHFTDANADGPWESDFAYIDGHLIPKRELSEEDMAKTEEFVVASFIIEGGAELYTAKYFTKNPQTYPVAHNFLIGFEWIYGSEALDDLFFSSDSTEKFIGYMREIGYSDEKIKNVIDSFNHYTYPDRVDTENKVRPEDVLIDLYKHEKGENWLEDKVFCHILQQLNQSFFDDAPLVHTEISNILITYCDMQDFIASVADQVEDGTQPGIFGPFKVIILDGKPYLTAELERTDDVEKDRPAALLLDYDFDNEKILSHEYYVHSYPQTLPKALPDGAQLKARLDSFKHDNSAAHEQTPFAGSADLQDIYDRAATIGNKYGVFIRLGEDMPSYVESRLFDEDQTMDKETLNEVLDHIESALSKFPEGYFDQFNYGYYSGFEIDIFKWPLYEEMTVRSTENGYMMCFSFNSICAEPFDVQEEKLVEAVFSATDLILLNHFENIEDPMFSEKVWKTKNPDKFFYPGKNTDEFIQEIYDEFKDYVVCKEAMRYAPKDRSTLMEALVDEKDVPEKCLEKAEFYSQCIREVFDDSGWPEETLWEKEIADLQKECGSKAA